LAIVSSVGLTLTLTGIPTDLFIVQLRAVAVPLTTGNWFDILNAIFIVIAVLTILTYFTFTREHTGALGYSTKIGRLIMMLALGGGFGMAILSQGTFLLNILLFLVRDWLHILA
jgi:hypothetical protein